MIQVLFTSVHFYENSMALVAGLAYTFSCVHDRNAYALGRKGRVVCNMFSEGKGQSNRFLDGKQD